MLALYVITVLLVVFGTDGYSTGAPNYNEIAGLTDAELTKLFADPRCGAGFRPLHRHGSDFIMPQSSGGDQFVLTVENTTPGRGLTYQILPETSTTRQEFKVTLRSTGAPFKGFFITADSESNGGAGVGGSYTPDPSERTPRSKEIRSCLLGATHTDGAPKTSVSFIWKPPTRKVAPPYHFGKIQFTAVVVQDFSRFWTGIRSVQSLSPSITTAKTWYDATFDATKAQTDAMAMFSTNFQQAKTKMAEAGPILMELNAEETANRQQKTARQRQAMSGMLQSPMMQQMAERAKQMMQQYQGQQGGGNPPPPPHGPPGGGAPLPNMQAMQDRMRQAMQAFQQRQGGTQQNQGYPPPNPFMG